MKTVLASLLFAVLFFLLGWQIREITVSNINTIEKTLEKIVIDTSLDRYSIEQLSETGVPTGKIKIEEMEKADGFDSYLFSFEFDPTLQTGQKKKTTGQINIPANRGTGSSNYKSAIILMIRGFAPQETYQTGTGTKRAAEVFARNGYITISPDFLGYAGSDKESENIFETRFQTYTTTLSLLKTLEESVRNPNLISTPDNSVSKITDHSSIFIWAHSNGGQIALTTLAVTGKEYPTTLWAPVTKPFPYSILFYTDKSLDRGKFLRKELAKFEGRYDVEMYTFDNYLEKINAPIQLQQGTKDTAIPEEWSKSFTDKMRKLDKDITYIVLPGADHNMRPRWEEAVTKDLEFFKKHIQNNSSN
jgi:alpha-beta hydrolase superfamily lysophospholipase